MPGEIHSSQHRNALSRLPSLPFFGLSSARSTAIQSMDPLFHMSLVWFLFNLDGSKDLELTRDLVSGSTV
ncbi:hypothetical protein CVT26_008641 [Gymnopilus dilepis]|uniref:Uncharacterized protein n=1 Tax=Gymnopilus dilepis TaxID=231916 RepID=A0A409XXW2_9AGAR|nr:hypothetical protein CVT26_008641 [Gymnopilus dilepis]